MNEAKKDNRTKAELVAEIAALRARLDEAEQTLDAIRSGAVDALVVSGPQGEQVFSLTGAEQVYRVIIEAMNEGALTMDLGGYILFSNRRFCEMMKMPMEAIVGKRLTNFAAPPQQPAIRALVADAQAGPVRQRLVLQVHGAPLPVQLSANLLVAANPPCICMVVSDLTELEASANSIKALREQQEALEYANWAIRRHGATLEGINGVFKAALTCQSERELGIACLDIAQKLTQSMTGAIGEINERGIEDIAISNPGWDIRSVIDANGDRRPAGSFKIPGIFGRVLSDGRPLFTNDPANHPDSSGLPNGSPPLKSFLGVPLIREGRVIGIMAVGNREGGYTQVEQDTLEALMPAIVEAFLRKRAEEALRESEKKYSNLVKYAPAAIYEMDLQGTKFFSVNETMCDILRYSREELLSMKPSDLLDEESRSLFKERMRKKLAGEKIDETFEYRVRRKDGEWIQIAVNVGAYAYTDAKPARAAVIAYDITERKKAETSLKERTRQLQDANKELESFSYSVSHDLRAPLRAIDGYSRMLLQKHAKNFDEDSRTKFNVIRDNTRMMGQLIDDLLEFSRLGRAQLSKATLDMGGLIREVWEELKIANANRRLTLKMAEIPPCRGDRVLIKQVLVNILANAIKFTRGREEASIEVGGAKHSSEIIYYVRDNGAGFDMQYYDKLFGVFQRLHGPDEFEGTGVGLAIVHRIITRHTGRVWAEGEIDKGACFSFSLPG